jgi:HlyD family secretion protein
MNRTDPVRRRWWLLALVLTGGGLAAFGHFMAVSLRGAAQTTDTAAGPPAYRTVACFGLVDIKDGILDLHPTVPGRVAEVRVQEGDYVSAGAVLLRMDDTLARDKVSEAQIALELAKYDADKARTLPEQHGIRIQQAESAITIAKARQNAARQVVQFMEEQERGGVPPSRREFIVARGEAQAADEDVRLKDSDLRLLKLNDPNIAVQIAKTNVLRAELAVKQAQDALSQFDVTAPRSGRVLQVAIAAGDVLTGMPREQAIEFAPDSPRVIRAEVEQAFASLVTEGLEVEIQDDTHAPGAWTGRVSHVADYYAKKRLGASDPLQFSDVRVMPFLIELDPGQANLRLRQRVLVTLKVPAR